MTSVTVGSGGSECRAEVAAGNLSGLSSDMRDNLRYRVSPSGNVSGCKSAGTGGKLSGSSTRVQLPPEAVCSRQLSGSNLKGTACLRKFRVGSWNVSSLSNRAAEVGLAFHRRKVDVGCVQETRFKGEGNRKYGKAGERYKLYWSGCKEGTDGVGIFVAEKWEETVVAVNRINARMMAVKIRVGDKVVNVFSAYAPQAGREEVDKEKFWIKLMMEMDRIPKDEMVILAGDLNGHVGRSCSGYEEVHGGFGFGDRNEEGNRILEAAVALELMICNTWFKKERTKLISYAAGGVESTVDYVLLRQRDRCMVRDAKIICGEECVPKHQLLVVDLLIKDKERKKARFVPKLKVWLLKDVKFREQFVAGMRENENVVKEVGSVNDKWKAMKKQWRDTAEKVVGWTKGKPRHEETWWWNETVQLAVEKKKKVFKEWFKDKKTENLEKYKIAKREARKLVAVAKGTKGKEIIENWQLEGNTSQAFRVAKRLGRERQDIKGVKCLKDDSGRIVTNEEDIKETWKKHMEKIMNEEFVWKKNIVSVSKEGPASRISELEVANAIKSMKLGKAPGLSGVVSEMIIAGEEVSVSWLTDLCNCIVKEGHVPEDWKSSVSIPIYKGKGDPMDCGSYRGVKLLEHAMKVIEKVLEKRIRAQVNIDEMQFGFMQGRGTTDAIFIARQLQEKYVSKKKDLFFAFVDLEKAFDRVPREVTIWALRQVGVEEWLVQTVMAMYEEARTVVRTPCGDSASFTVNVGVHQGSVLSPLLFVIVMEAVTRDVRIGLPWELLYADDLILVSETVEDLKERLHRWKMALEEKGMRVNVDKTKVMICGEGEKDGTCEKYGKFPCGICGKGVGRNSVFCATCSKWVHKRCSGIKGKLEGELEGFVCKRCSEVKQEEQNAPLEGGQGVEKREMDMGRNLKLEVVSNFCYLGDVLDSQGGMEMALNARIKKGWNAFRQLAPLLLCKGVSLVVKGRVYDACVRSSMLYGSEAWACKMADEVRVERNDMRMIRWICGAKLSDRIQSEVLRRRLGLEDIKIVMKKRRLRWFGHVERRDEGWIKKALTMEVAGTRPKGRPRKTWMEMVEKDMRDMGLKKQDAKDRGVWRSGINGRGRRVAR